MRKLLLLMLSVMTLCFTGCSDIEKLKGAKLGGRPNITVGQAFDAAFNMPDWTESKGKNKEKVIVFNGLISNELHRRGVDNAFNEFYFKRQHPADDDSKSIIINQIFPALGGRDEFDKIMLHFRNQGLNWNDARQATYYLAFTKTEWPIGEQMDFIWTPNKDGQHFEIAEIKSDAVVGKNINSVLDVVYGTDFHKDNKYEQFYAEQAMANCKTVAPIVYEYLAKQNEINNSAVETQNQEKLLSLPADKVDEIAESFLSPPKKENVLGNWVRVGRLPDQYGGSITRLATDDAHETGSRFSRDFLFLDFDDRDPSVPAINLAVGVVISLDEAIQAYAGVKMFDVLVDGQKQGRIKMIGRPTPSEGYMYLEYSECPAISLVYRAMVSGQRVEFVNLQDKFSFDLKGLSSAAGAI